MTYLTQPSLSGVFYSEVPSNIIPLPVPKGDGWAWVRPWLNGKYPDNLTRKRYLYAWAALERFIAEQGVSLADFTRAHSYQFVEWRNVGRNTAKHELKVLSLICAEALERGLITRNPAEKLRLPKPIAKQKPEITPDMEREIIAAIESTKGQLRDFYFISFMLAMKHGIRMAETRLPLSDVKLDATPPLITFRMKGSKVHTVPLHPELVPVFTRLKEQEKVWTFTKPAKPGAMSVAWLRFWRKHGFDKRIPGVVFHSCRVSTISRLARANVSQAKAMRFVNHSSEVVHKVYQRVQLSDLNDCLL